MLVSMNVLVALANTGHVEVDQLATNDGVREWWNGLRLDSPADPASPGSEADLEVLRATRDVIRGLGLQHNGVDDPVDASALGAISLRLQLTDRPEVVVDGPANLPRHIVGRAVGELLKSWGDPDWHRLKACVGPGCGLVFVDRSRNGSRRWCQMSDCGNRAKGARLRARKRGIQ
jgi:hypothetical protein